MVVVVVVKTGRFGAVEGLILQGVILLLFLNTAACAAECSLSKNDMGG